MQQQKWGQRTYTGEAGLAGEQGWGQMWVPRRVQWAAMLEGVGGLGERGHKCLLSAGSRVAASFLRG